MSYADLLRDPRWQRKRLEVMERADFKCEACSDGTSTLNVHHEKYVRGRMPWEYDYDELHCLCEKCHRSEHGIKTIEDRRAEAARERDRVRHEEWRAKYPAVAALDDRLAAIRLAMPSTPEGQKDALVDQMIETIRERMELINRENIPQRWKRFR